MIVAPTNPDAKRCVELAKSGMIDVLGGRASPLILDWNRGEGKLHLANGATVHTDGANDGAFRIQGYNLRGAWCDEIGLWEQWERAWNQSLLPAIRQEPARIVATGTPKIGHGLVAKLIADAKVPYTRMRTIDNIANLHEEAVADLYAELGGTTLGRQELEGEFIASLEGGVLPRHAWEFFDADLPVSAADLHDHRNAVLRKLPMIVHSWDTTWKAKATSDFVSGQCWGVAMPDRYLLALYHERASLEAVITAMLAQVEWARKLWPDAQQWVLIEQAAWGPEAAAAISRVIDGVVRVRVRGDKFARAMAASPALESGHCHLPGVKDPDPNSKGYADSTPPRVQAFVEECALFQADMRHAHDDQVDGWSQMVNWTSGRRGQASVRFGRPTGHLGRPGSLARV